MHRHFKDETLLWDNNSNITKSCYLHDLKLCLEMKASLVSTTYLITKEIAVMKETDKNM